MWAKSHSQLLYLRYKNNTVTMVWSYEMIVFDIVHKLTAEIVQLSDITVTSDFFRIFNYHPLLCNWEN